jgi:hypothetical protein
VTRLLLIEVTFVKKVTTALLVQLLYSTLVHQEHTVGTELA